MSLNNQVFRANMNQGQEKNRKKLILPNNCAKYFMIPNLLNYVYFALWCLNYRGHICSLSDKRVQ